MSSTVNLPHKCLLITLAWSIGGGGRGGGTAKHKLSNYRLPTPGKKRPSILMDVGCCFRIDLCSEEIEWMAQNCLFNVYIDQFITKYENDCNG
uniref:Putative secreted protein n=1 Tax=Anopheles darlingi TaxID=43151 RepID=A0A2M4D7J8_ANODA